MKSPANIADHIRVRHGQFVILDADLAALFDVGPERLAELVQKDQTMQMSEFSFPARFHEIPVSTRAFTEFGVLMVASTLDTPHAVEMSTQIVRAIVKMRETPGSRIEASTSGRRQVRELH